VSTEAVYAAETTLDPGRAFGTVVEIQDYLDALCANDWWNERFPGVVRIEAVGIRSRCVDGVGRPDPDRNAGVIGMTADGRKELIVLHEVAHVLCRPDAGHGPAWVRTYLELAYRLMGTEAWARLRTALVARGVDIGSR
jgi:putative metallohydrolase (TIGR04338 family)